MQTRVVIAAAQTAFNSSRGGLTQMVVDQGIAAVGVVTTRRCVNGEVVEA